MELGRCMFFDILNEWHYGLIIYFLKTFNKGNEKATGILENSNKQVRKQISTFLSWLQFYFPQFKHYLLSYVCLAMHIIGVYVALV